MVTEVRGDFEHAIASIDETATTASGMIKALEPDIVAMTGAARRISDDTSRMLAGIREGRGTIGKLMNDDETVRAGESHYAGGRTSGAADA